MDPTVQVAMIGVFATMISTIGIFAVAVLNNRKERENSAFNAIEKTKDERIAFRDDRIESLSKDKAELERELEKEESKNEALRAQISIKEEEIMKLRRRLYERNVSE